MKRNMLLDRISQDKLIEHKKRIAFHEAGHAAAIYLNNKARNLPPVFFQIIFKDLNGMSEEDSLIYQSTHDDCIAKVDGGRLIDLLLPSTEEFEPKPSSQDEMLCLVNDYMNAFEADIINLIVGPLAEAKYVADTDGELFNQQLVNLKALINYGGCSDLKLANDYLHGFYTRKKEIDEKLTALFAVAFDFINEQRNWIAITKLANYILDGNKNIIDCEEVAALLEN